MAWKPIELMLDDIAGLGDAEATYQWPLSVLLFRCFFAIAICALGLLVLLVATKLAFDDPESIIFGVAVGLPIFGAGILSLRKSYLKRQIRVIVFRDALVIKKHDQFALIPWRDIQQFHQRVVQHTAHGITVEMDYIYELGLGHGEEITIAEKLTRIEELGAIIEQRTSGA
jgi:hypothetical protein